MSYGQEVKIWKKQERLLNIEVERNEETVFPCGLSYKFVKKNEGVNMSNKTIYNCHNHIFTHENIPNRYFPFFLVPITRIGPFRWALRGVMKLIVPWTKNDKVHRYAAFIKAAYRKKQEENLKALIGYYPTGTKFIILPMDMAYMGAGKIKEDIDEQHDELIGLEKKHNDELKELMTPVQRAKFMILQKKLRHKIKTIIETMERRDRRREKRRGHNPSMERDNDPMHFEDESP